MLTDRPQHPYCNSINEHAKYFCIYRAPPSVCNDSSRICICPVGRYTPDNPANPTECIGMKSNPTTLLEILVWKGPMSVDQNQNPDRTGALDQLPNPIQVFFVGMPNPFFLHLSRSFLDFCLCAYFIVRY